MTAIGLQSVVGWVPDEVITKDDSAHLEAVTPPGMQAFFYPADELRRMRGKGCQEKAGEKVGRMALDRAGLEISDIDCLISSNSPSDQFFYYPAMGAALHHALGMERSAPVMNVQSQCATFVDALAAAWELIRAGAASKVLVVMAMAYDVDGRGIADPTDPMYRMVGDGACAAVVSKENLIAEFLSWTALVAGRMHRETVFRLRPRMNPHVIPGSEGVLGNYASAGDASDWAMAEDFAIVTVEDAAKKAGIPLTDVDLIFFHQVGGFGDPWMVGGEKRGIPRERWIDTFHQYGATGNSDVGITLAETWESGNIPPGSIIALHGSGGSGSTPVLLGRWLAPPSACGEGE